MRGIVADIPPGSELVLIGNGSPEQGQEFVAEEHLDLPLFVDPSLAAYQAAGLTRGVLPALDPRVALGAALAVARGFRQGMISGDALQIGGVLVFAAGGELVLHHAGSRPGDHPPPQRIVEALRQAVAPWGELGQDSGSSAG